MTIIIHIYTYTYTYVGSNINSEDLILSDESLHYPEQAQAGTYLCILEWKQGKRFCHERTLKILVCKSLIPTFGLLILITY